MEFSPNHMMTRLLTENKWEIVVSLRYNEIYICTVGVAKYRIVFKTEKGDFKILLLGNQYINIPCSKRFKWLLYEAEDFRYMIVSGVFDGNDFSSPQIEKVNYSDLLG